MLLYFSLPRGDWPRPARPLWETSTHAIVATSGACDGSAESPFQSFASCVSISIIDRSAHNNCLVYFGLRRAVKLGARRFSRKHRFVTDRTFQRRRYIGYPGASPGSLMSKCTPKASFSVATTFGSDGCPHMSPVYIERNWGECA